MAEQSLNDGLAAPKPYEPPIGITDPPLDELLTKVSSKYALVVFAAKRARQINDYYNQLAEGILEYLSLIHI